MATMAGTLRDRRVLLIDAQASGATPAHGDLLELAWGVGDVQGVARDVQSFYVLPRTERRISAAVREITGYSEARHAHSHDERVVFEALRRDVSKLAAETGRVSTAIHVARFELPYLRDLALRLSGEELPLDVCCVHAVATRLFPDLPRRNIRALAGYLGHAVGLVRSAAEHVEATAFIWGALVRELEARGVHTDDELAAFLNEKPSVRPSKKRSFPLSPEIRRALPDRPGVYRFLRKNGDVLYVGKATSLKKRIAGHFRPTGTRTERTLELLSQVSDIRFTETPSTLEAALLETDEIKAIDPPYNVQLRVHERAAWFANRALDETSTTPSETFSIGPLPSRGAVMAMHALNALCAGHERTPRLAAMALAVPVSFLPPPELMALGFERFLDELEVLGGRDPRFRARRAARALRGEAPDESEPDLPPDGWDLARVRRRLTRNLVQADTLLWRALALGLLSDADVAFREPGAGSARLLRLSRGELLAQSDLASVDDLARLAPRAVATRIERLAAFTASHYDRLRVIATELTRILSEGGDVEVRVGKHVAKRATLRALSGVARSEPPVDRSEAG